jgi:hypothetical protein
MPEFQAPDLDRMSVDEMIDSVDIWYHRLELLGRTTPGAYDMAPVADRYKIASPKAAVGGPEWSKSREEPSRGRESPNLMSSRATSCSYTADWQ